MITESIISIGKNAGSKGRAIDCLASYHGKTLLSYALDEARAAGARRFFIAFPKGYAARDALAETRRFLASPDEELIPYEGGTENWDLTTVEALAMPDSDTFWLSDPTMLMLKDGDPVTDLPMALTTRSRERKHPVLAALNLGWEQALHQAQLRHRGDGYFGPRPDRHGEGIDEQPFVFVGRAVINRLTGAETDPVFAQSPDDSAFPGEHLIDHLTRQGPGAVIAVAESDVSLAAVDMLRPVGAGIFTPPRWLLPVQVGDRNEVA
jgi:hypothetical protein